MQGMSANSLREDSVNPGFFLEYIVFTRRKTGVGLSKECSYIKFPISDDFGLDENFQFHIQPTVEKQKHEDLAHY